MAPRVPIEDRRFIARLFVEGVPQRAIAQRTGRSKAAVTRIIRAFRDDGTLADAKRSGRPIVTNHEDDILIVAAAVVDPFLSAKEIRNEQSPGISTATVTRRLKEAGVSSFSAAQKPFLPERQRQQRRDFALNHQRWIDFLHTVGSTEEGVAAHEFESVLSSGRCSVSVWGAISKDGLGPLVRTDGKFTASYYSFLLQNTMLPCVLDGPFADGCFIFQQDKSPVRMARQPPCGADANPIENVWARMKWGLSRRYLSRASADTLWNAIQEELDALRSDGDYVTSLYKSMPRRSEGTRRSDGVTVRFSDYPYLVALVQARIGGAVCRLYGAYVNERLALSLKVQMAAQSAPWGLQTGDRAGEPSGSAQGEDNARTPQRLPNRSFCSPTERCVICMERPKDKALPDCCDHTFCFSCLVKWARVQAKCPLCKREFSSIMHDFCSSGVYKRYFISLQRRCSEFTEDDSVITHAYAAVDELRELDIMRSRQERARREAQPYVALPNPSPYNPRQAATTRDRLEVYEFDLWAVPRLSNYRETSPEFYCSHPSHTLRLVPWVTRELTALMQAPQAHVVAAVNNVLELIRNFGIRHPEFSRRMEPLLQGYREHFVYELYLFASSVFETMDDYDRNIVYASRSMVDSRANQFQRSIGASSESGQAPSLAPRAVPVADRCDSPQLDSNGLDSSSSTEHTASSTGSDSDSDSSDCVTMEE
ncbi:hypothetical protein HPB50_007203 [Hyalomma asiaticum]|uniref:Uncharacterized protein n=1 Tax=Hyalomma asiaticum TaxID=266040 RepID=A0ACB7TIA8_HYAAI|nr:hypothetical protein HPB50_007203 [Hyalomma asiaticum]